MIPSNNQVTRLSPPAASVAYPDWLEWLDSNRLTSVAAWQLADEPLPNDVRTYLKAAYAQTQALWLLRKHETVRIINCLEQSPPISFILLKGVALASTLYPTPAQRPMNDVDFLVPIDSLGVLADRLKSYGYLEEGHTDGLDITKRYQLCFVNSGITPRLKLEFHAFFTHLQAENESLAMKWFWSQTETFDFANYSVQSLNPTASILYLAAHAMQEHGIGRAPLIWIYDVNLLIRERSNDIDWPTLFEIAKVFQWEASLFYACKLAESNFNTPVPPPLQHWLQKDPMRLSGIDIVISLASDDVTRSMGMMQFLRSLPLSRRIQYITRLIFPSTSYMRHRYHLTSALYLPFAYLYRWFDIIGDLCITTCSSLRRRL